MPTFRDCVLHGIEGLEVAWLVMAWAKAVHGCAAKILRQMFLKFVWLLSSKCVSFSPSLDFFNASARCFFKVSNIFYILLKLYIYIYLFNIIEGSLEAKLPTIWRDEKAVSREKSQKRKDQKKEDAGARKGRKVAKHCFFAVLWLRRVEK